MSTDLFRLDNEIAIVTGGLGQLGHQYTKALLQAGAQVAVFDLHNDPQIISQRYGEFASNAQLSFFAVDITDKSTIIQALNEVIDQWDTPTVLVNNAALDSPPDAPSEENGPFETYPEASFDRILEVNTKGTFLCCQIIGAAMAQAGKGSIINISSIYGVLSPKQPIYDYRIKQDGNRFCKTRGIFSIKIGCDEPNNRYLATYWAKDGVRVNTLTLAGVFNNQDPEFLRNYTEHVPLGRMANEDDYNGAVIFLASQASAYMTGANLVVDGGWTAW